MRLRAVEGCCKSWIQGLLPHDPHRKPNSHLETAVLEAAVPSRPRPLNEEWLLGEYLS